MTVTSRTAVSMALFRAIETAKDENSRLINDPYAAHCLPLKYRAVARAAKHRSLRHRIERFIDWRYPGARSSGVARTRLIDDWLIAESENGLDQVVVLGAGFDSRCYRLREFASIPVFELDRAAVLSEKARVFERRIPNSPKTRAAVPIDFLQNCIAEKLLASGFHQAAKNLVLWEGVTNYLTGLAVANVFRTFASLSLPGTSIVFTYVHKDALDCRFDTVGLARLHRSLARWGEPWTFGFQPDDLRDFLAEYGYELIHDFGAAEYRQAYYGLPSARFKGYEFYRAAKATLVSQGNKRRKRHAACRS